jgi:MFS family permease
VPDVDAPDGSMNRDARHIALALLLWGFGEGLFFYIQPLYFEQLGATPVQIGGLLSVANVVRAATYLPAGILADCVPRKWVMTGGWIMGLVGILLVALARSWQGLIPGLLIYAISAYCIPVINAYLAHAVGGRNLARTFTTVFAGFAVGGVVSPAVGGWLAEVTTMRMVYFTSALLFVISMLAIVQVSPQPVPTREGKSGRWRSLLSGRFVRFAAFTSLMFVAMYLAFPLAPNFLRDVGGWRVARIGMLGSFQALGTALFNPLLGRLGEGRRSRETSSAGVMGRAWGLVVGSGVVWSSVLVLLLAQGFPLLAVAYLLRGAYQGCRSLTQAKATGLANEADRGLLLGVTETLIATAQVVAPYAAGWLYVSDPTYPFLSSLLLIPVVLLVGVVGSRL